MDAAELSDRGRVLRVLRDVTEESGYASAVEALSRMAEAGVRHGRRDREPPRGGHSQRQGGRHLRRAGDIKRNWGFRRFLLRGLEKVDHEMRMVAMGHNIRKLTYALAV